MLAEALLGTRAYEEALSFFGISRKGSLIIHESGMDWARLMTD